MLTVLRFEKKILKGISYFKKSEGKFRLDAALSYAGEVAKEIEKSKAVKQLEFAGSLRRRKELIGDVDILVTSGRPKKVNPGGPSWPFPVLQQTF